MEDSALKQFIATFMFLQRFDCPQAIDEMFLKLITEDWAGESFETNKILITTFCRVNYQIKDQLKNYQPFLEKSIKYLESNNYEPSQLLKGII